MNKEIILSIKLSAINYSIHLSDNILLQSAVFPTKQFTKCFDFLFFFRHSKRRVYAKNIVFLHKSCRKKDDNR
jgi:hypothetical protein